MKIGSYILKPLQNLIFLIVIKNKFLKFQLVIFLKFVNLGVLQRFHIRHQIASETKNQAA